MVKVIEDNNSNELNDNIIDKKKCDYYNKTEKKSNAVEINIKTS